MQGMSNQNGKYLDDLEHLKQSIVDILTTPIGSRVICRDYGSKLFQLTDQPINRDLFPKIYAAVAEAINKWEPRLKLDQVRIVSIKEGHIILSLVGIYLVTQQKVELKEIEI